MRIEALIPIRVRRSGAELRLVPGVPVDLPEAEALKLLQRAPNKVRVVGDDRVTIEPAVKPDGSPLTPVYWQRPDGSIAGPAHVEFFCQLFGSDGLIVALKGALFWINANLLRSRSTFETQQRSLVEVDREILKA